MKILKFAAALTVATLLVSCGPPKSTDETAYHKTPSDLTVAVNHESMMVTWKVAGSGLISGYNIYVSETPLVGNYPGQTLPPHIKSHNLNTYAGDTDPNDGIESYEAHGLTDGIEYYVSVRVVYPDLTLSLPSNETRVVCGPRGEFELAVRFQGKPDGYSFELRQAVDADAVENDLYFYSKDGIDYLASPSRLDGFLLDSRLMRLPFGGDLDEIGDRLNSLGSLPDKDRVAVEPGTWVWILTAAKENALVRVIDLKGRAESRRVQLFYAFEPRSGKPVF